MNRLPTLYSRTSKGAVQQWTIEIDGDRYRTTYGQIDGKQTTTEWYTVVPTNLGKANERDGNAQALAEAQAIWKKRIKVGYQEDVNDIDKDTIGLDVMLAKELDKYLGTKKNCIDFSKGLLVQNKFNGVRCSAQLEDGKVVLRSRGFEIWNTVPHINKSLEGFFRNHPDAKLDGELYNYDLRQKLNELIEIVRSKRPTAEELALSEQMVRYYIYDGFDFNGLDGVLGADTPYFIRKGFIDLTLPQYSKYYREVKTWTVYSLAELDKLYESFLADGEEGAIGRERDGVYKSGRSRDLLKYKPEDDAEGTIIDIYEGTGNWAGAATPVLLEWNGKQFRGVFKGKYEQRVEILKNKVDWIGREVTFKYTGLTGLGTPNYARIDPNNCFKAD